MTEQSYGPPFVDPPPKPRRRRHIFRWVFLAIQMLFLVWIITGANAGAHANNCAAQADPNLCHQATAAGTGLAVFMIVFLWMAVDVILGIGYLIFRRRG